MTESLRRVIHLAALRFRDAASLTDLYEVILKLTDALHAEVGRHQPPPRLLACAPGCAFCCSWNEVNLSPLEVLVMAAFMRSHYSDVQIGDLKVLLRACVKAKTQAAERKAKDLFSCPMLVENRCIAYAVRPFVCRGFTSFDAGTCAARVSVFGYIHTQKIAQLSINVIGLELEEMGYETQLLDLAPALDIALSGPAPLADWLAGRHAFGQAASRRG